MFFFVGSAPSVHFVVVLIAWPPEKPVISSFFKELNVQCSIENRVVRQQAIPEKKAKDAIKIKRNNSNWIFSFIYLHLRLRSHCCLSLLIHINYISFLVRAWDLSRCSGSVITAHRIAQNITHVRKCCTANDGNNNTHLHHHHHQEQLLSASLDVSRLTHTHTQSRKSKLIEINDLRECSISNRMQWPYICVCVHIFHPIKKQPTHTERISNNSLRLSEHSHIRKHFCHFT